MRVSFVPQRTDADVSYSFDGERITVAMQGGMDIFDFSPLPNGEAAEIVSALDPCPVLAARRMDGELHVTLLRPVPARPTNAQELEAWKRLWTDDLEVVIGG